MSLPADFVAQWKEALGPSTMFGQRMDTLTRDELLATIGWLCHEHHECREERDRLSQQRFDWALEAAKGRLQ